MWPFIMLKNILDGNYWAEKIGNKTGAYDKAHNSKLAQWLRSLTGWKWWAWQIGCGTVSRVSTVSTFSRSAGSGVDS